MKFTEKQIKATSTAMLKEFLELVKRGNLNGGTAARILGVSRSRYTQLSKEPEKPVALQAHIYLNLLWANQELAQGLENGWLPASGHKGAAQQAVLDRLSPQ